MSDLVRRLPIAVLGAAMVTGALAYLMITLIQVDALDLTRLATLRAVGFVRVDAETPTEVKRRTPPDKPRATEPPSVPAIEVRRADLRRPDTQPLSLNVPDAQGQFSLLGSVGLAAPSSDSSYVPLVRVQPFYPVQARQRRQEGWVELRFTIDARGFVVDAVVERSSPPGVFDRAAVSAVRKWRYKPRLEHGKPVVTAGVRVKLTFELED